MPRHMDSVFMGLDVGGKDGTILTTLSVGAKGRLLLKRSEKILHLQDLGDKLRANAEVCAKGYLCIDAPLTYDLSEPGGLRQIDRKYRNVIPGEFNDPSWVLSIHGLMAVPIKGLWAAKLANDLKYDVIETHPRVCLALMFQEIPELVAAIASYKAGKYASKTDQLQPKAEVQDKCDLIWEWIQSHFDIEIQADLPTCNDDQIDSLVCALVSAAVGTDQTGPHGAPYWLARRKWDVKESLIGIEGTFALIGAESPDLLHDERIDPSI